MKTINTLAFITLTGALFGAVSSTLAGDVQSKSVDVRSRVVSFYDLDLANPPDARTLLDRIHKAARDACSRSGDRPVDLNANIDRDRCMNTSFTNTVVQVDSRFNTSIEKVAGMAGEQQDLMSKR